jgi:NAD(P)-dependent dehydrogenase (short-subunit alcohol dehydrogenase family)
MWRFLTETNLIFPGIMVSSVLNGMMERGWGRILLFGGTRTTEITGFTSTASYSAAKTALGTLAKSAAKAAAGKNITCNVICPGFTDTEYCSAAELDYNRRHSSGGKALQPGEVASFALKVLENPQLNGAGLNADSGRINA